MRVLYCCLGDFKAPPGAKQILLAAQELSEAGHECAILVENDPASVRFVGGGPWHVETGRFEFRGPVLSQATVEWARAFAPDVIHCYEPRTAPLRAALALSRKLVVPLCVRFADDDDLLMREAGGSGLRRWVGAPALMAAGTLVPTRWPYKHPLWHRRMLNRTVAFDAIVPALAQEMERRLGRPCEFIPPAASTPDEAQPAAEGSSLRARLGLPESGRLIVYTGSVFRPHFSDFSILLRAFAVVARKHPDVQLVHTGRIAERYAIDELRSMAGGERAHFLGFLEDPADLSRLLENATVLTQPGAPTQFNRLRLPAKVPEYLMTGVPVVTFGVGAGELLEDEHDAVLTQTAEPAELAERIEFVLADDERAARIGRAGRERAVELFGADRVAGQMQDYYERVLGRSVRGHAVGVTR